MMISYRQADLFDSFKGTETTGILCKIHSTKLNKNVWAVKVEGMPGHISPYFVLRNQEKYSNLSGKATVKVRYYMKDHTADII